ncbi:hypothetical protein [Pseudochryseolinea flava]|uniref:3-keto-disaccharide hydrolase domain-containing protein n=1 Tax=Pseudochryseolinea flava TaxID=2059302 RepID=A0A364Y2F5_9BACT|nr:hypothetical protein [Pseudochryseolinea flava]RAW00862.1 hypothetical protein DQQ10_11500 [Pseudochryseolinea flava]
MLKTKLSIVVLSMISLASVAQSKFDLSKLANDKKLVMSNRALVVDTKTKSIKLDERSGQGLATIKDVTFTTGTIEVDLKGKDVVQKSFIGVAFHIQNDSTFEAIYFRPFNFHAEDPIRKIHAVQYVFQPVYTWYKLREERNGEFEKAIDNAPNANDWFRAKIEVTDQEVLVYVNNSATPSLKVARLSTSNTGGIALWTGEGSGGEFKSLVISK